MKEIIKEVLDGMSGSQMNLESDGAREVIASTISSELKKRGHYREFPSDNDASVRPVVVSFALSKSVRMMVSPTLSP